MFAFLRFCEMMDCVFVLVFLFYLIAAICEVAYHIYVYALLKSFFQRVGEIGYDDRLASPSRENTVPFSHWHQLIPKMGLIDWKDGANWYEYYKKYNQKAENRA